MEFITIGDLHLDKPRLNNIIPNVLDLQMAAVKTILDYAVSKSVKNIFFLGDIADMPRLSDVSAKAFYNLLLDYPGLMFYIILGNHDIEQVTVNSLTTLDTFVKRGLLPNIKIFSEPTKEKVDGEYVGFVPYPYHEPFDCLNIGHIERPGATRDNGSQMKDTEGHPETNGQPWIMGHLHTPHKVGNTIYCGTPYQTSFGESLPKRFLHCRYTKGKLSIKEPPYEPPFKLITLKADSLKDLKKQITDDPNSYWRIMYKGFELPPDFLMKYPNVIETHAYKTKEQLKDILDFEETPYQVTDGLTEFLKDRGFNKKQIKRAFKLVDKALA